MNRNLKSFTLLAAIGIAFLISSCSKADTEVVNKSATNEASAQLNTDRDDNCDFTAVLTEDEIADLMHMRQEEKVARDVYLKFYELYDKPIFSNIARSEKNHMDAILNLIEGYGLTDPVADKEEGEFTADFQELYNNLVAEGSVSITAAYEVGVKIEELDIADLEECIASTEVENLLRVYSNLLAGSGNHLNAFSSKL